MTMALVALEEIVNRQQDQGTTVVCRSQTAPITHLEPAAQTAREDVEPLVLRSATGCRDRAARAPVCLYKSLPASDSYVVKFLTFISNQHFFSALSLVLMQSLL